MNWVMQSIRERVERLPGPSSLYRIAACMLSEALPHVQTRGGLPSHKGSIAHTFLADSKTVGREEAFNRAPPEDVGWLSNIPEDFLPATDATWIVEVSFAFNPETETCRILGQNLSRNAAYALAKPGEMVGTADLICIEVRDGVQYITVLDYKTGRGYVEKALTNWQLWTYLLMACRAYNVDQGKCGIVRVMDTGATWFDWSGEANAFAIDAHAANLRTLLRARRKAMQDPEAALATVEPQVGDHCHYCPAFDSCPATTRLLRIAAQAREQTPTMSVFEAELSALSEVDKAKAYEMLCHAEDAVKRAWKDFDRMVRATGPVPLREDHVYGPKEIPKESVIPERAVPALLEMFGDEVGNRVVGEALVSEESMTKEGLKRALKEYVLPTLPKERQRITWLVDETLEALRQRRALTLNVEKRLMAHRPKGEPTQ